MPSPFRPAPLKLPPRDGAFVAIDFETADHGADSACAVGLVRVENMEVVRREVVLIRPPRPRILFTHVHGITWQMVAKAPTFGEVWPLIENILEGATHFTAHNATFDRRVLEACCNAAKLPVPPLPFLCSVHIARKRWGLKPNNLPAVCRRLGIGLIHHDAGSDAEACARIVIAAAAQDAEQLNGLSLPHPLANPTPRRS